MGLQTVVSEAEAILAALKALLRERRISYQQLAEAMDVSLPTVKRMLNKTSLPLDRLLSICHLLEVDPEELLDRAEKYRPRHTLFTDEQDCLFSERPAFLQYFKRLLYEGDSPEAIAKSEGLTPLSTERYLNGLERVGLLDRQVGTAIRLKVKAPMGFGPDSRVLRTEHTRLLTETVAQVLSPDAERVFAILKPLCLSKEQSREMVDELMQMVDKFAYLSAHPRGESDEREHWSFTTSLSLAEDPPAVEIPNLTE